MQRDISHFANSKLQGGWSAPEFAKYVTKEALQTLILRFDKLEPLVRVRLLLSILSLDSDARDNLRSELQRLVALAKDDKDEWVSVVAKAVGAFDGSLDLKALLTGSTAVQNTVQALERLVQTSDSSSVFRPLEDAYVNTALVTSAQRGPEPEHHHFVPRDNASGSLPELSLKVASAAAAASQRSKSGAASPQRPPLGHTRHLDPGGASALEPQNHASAAASGSTAGPGDMFRSSKPLLPSANRQVAVATHQERRGDARPRNIKLLDVDEVKKLNRSSAPSHDTGSLALNGSAALPMESEEAEEGELEAGELPVDGRDFLARKRQKYWESGVAG